MIHLINFKAKKLNMKWVETTFPFTHPSYELEIEYKGQWYEVLGCGILKNEILQNGNNLLRHNQMIKMC